MKKKAISYIRLSSDKQIDGHSIDRQTRATKDYCEANNLELIEELADIGVSGYSGANRDKGQLRQFFQGLEDGTVPQGIVLIVENLDRLSRQNPLAALSQFTELLNHGVELHTLFDRQVYTKESMGTNVGQLFLSVGQMVRSFDESATKSKRLKAVWSKKKQDKDSIVTSQVPYWVKVIKDTQGKAQRFELRDNEARSIRHIFELSINKNLGAQAITTYLNENIDSFPRTRTNSRNKDKGWAESYVKSVLNNPAVYGLYQPHKRVDGKRVPDGEPFRNYYPQVISEEEFLLNQKKIAQRKIKGGGRKSKNFNNLFRGMVYCHGCGSKMSYKFNISSKGGPVLRCEMATQKRANCKALPVRYEAFEELMFMACKDIDFMSAINNKEFQAKEREIELQIGKLEEELSKIKKQLDVLVEELLEPEQPTSVKQLLRTKLNNLTEQEQTTTKQLEVLKDELLVVGGGDVDGLFDDVKTMLDGVEGDALVELRSSLNVGFQKVLDKIEIDNVPLFDKEDVEWGVEEMGLNEQFLEWFKTTRTDRWLIKDPVAYVATRFGFKMHQNFRTTTYLFFKTGELRGVGPDGKFFKMSAQSRKPFATKDK